MKLRHICSLILIVIICLFCISCRRQEQGGEVTSLSEAETSQVTYSLEERRVMEMLSGMVSYGELMEYTDFELIDVDTDLQKDPIVYYGQKNGLSCIRRESGAEEYTLDRDGIRFTYRLQDGVAELEDYLFLEDLDAAALTTSGLELAVTGTDLYLNHASLPTLTPEDIVTETVTGGKTLRVGVDYFARFARALCEAQGMTAKETEDVLESFTMELVYDVDRNRMKIDGGWTSPYITYTEMDFGMVMNNQALVDTTLKGDVFLTEDGTALEKVVLETVRTDGEAKVKSTVEIYDMVLSEGTMISCKTDTKEQFTCTVTVGTYRDQVTYDVIATIKSKTVFAPNEYTVMTHQTEQETRMVAVGKNYSVNSFENLSVAVNRREADTYGLELSYHKNGSQKTGYLKATLKTTVNAVPNTVPAAIEQAISEALADGGEVARMAWEREAIDAVIEHLNETYPAAPIWFSCNLIIDAQEGGDILSLIVDQTRTTPDDYRISEYHRTSAVDRSYYEINEIPYYRYQNGELVTLWLPENMDYLDRFSRAFLESDYDVEMNQRYHVMDSSAGYALMFEWMSDHLGAIHCLPLEQFSYENFLASEESLPDSMRSIELKYVDGKLP